jgi:hypothetical protein
LGRPSTWPGGPLFFFSEEAMTEYLLDRYPDGT